MQRSHGGTDRKPPAMRGTIRLINMHKDTTLVPGTHPREIRFGRVRIGRLTPTPQ